MGSHWFYMGCLQLAEASGSHGLRALLVVWVHMGCWSLSTEVCYTFISMQGDELRSQYVLVLVL